MLHEIIHGAYKRPPTNTNNLATLATLALANSAGLENIPVQIEGVTANNGDSSATANAANLANSAIANHSREISALSQELFERLYDQLKGHYRWTKSDYEAWLSDLQDDPESTLGCLEALANSWQDNRYGVLEPKDWKQPMQLFRGLTLEQSRVVRTILNTRTINDDRKLCAECDHLLAIGGSWKCGNWKDAGLAFSSSGDGLSWHRITLFQRCNGFGSKNMVSE